MDVFDFERIVDLSAGKENPKITVESYEEKLEFEIALTFVLSQFEKVDRPPRKFFVSCHERIGQTTGKSSAFQIKSKPELRLESFFSTSD